ncbi:MAG TPA: methyltransferase domain-containing protein [Methylomirabilota bacterium]|nr:methyltransferase domain-containing protein [Methylomirabilota bacterium]
MTNLWTFALLLFAGMASSFAQYETRTDHDPDGIGKFYMGREIAHVMGHQGADWLERPEREVEEKPDLLVENLGLKPGDHAADLGAGTGYFSWRMAKAVGPKGRVHAIEIQQEMLDLLQRNMKQRGVTNVVSALGTITNINIPRNSLDLLLMVDVYHEVSHPQEILRSIHAALKPTGKLVFVEYRKEDPRVPIKEVHKMSEAQVRKEAEANGFKWIKTVSALPRQHMIFFEPKK